MAYVVAAQPSNGNARDRSRTPRPAVAAQASSAAAVAISQGHLIGTVRQFRDHWGFIVSDQVPGDIYVNLRDNPQLGGQLQAGEAVQFDLDYRGSAERNNGTRAINVQRLGGVVAAAPPQVQVPQATAVVSNVVSNVAAVAISQGHLIGTVRQFRDHWGFIVSDQVQGDIYVSLRDNPQLGGPLTPGEAVHFDLDFRGSAERNNGTRAVNVQRLGGATMVPVQQVHQVQQVQHVPQPQVQRAVPQQRVVPVPMQVPVQQVQMPQQRVVMVQAQPMMAMKPAPAAQYHGKLVAFKDGWGWLESPALTGQVFMGLKDNAHLPAAPNVGDQLVFELAPGAKGRSKAINVQPSFVGQRVVGTVKSLRDGWGFAVSEGLPGTVMLGKKNLTASGIDGATLQVGDSLEFELAAGPKGYEASAIAKL